jgi:glycosyltransferase involved in cell wall biosynthesis
MGSTQSGQLKHLLMATVEDAFDPRSWSGIPFSLRQALERQVERVTVFRPGLPSRHPVDVLLRLYYGGEPPSYPLHLTQATFRKNSRELRQEIERVQPDAVLSISSPCVIGLGAVGRPVFMFCDAPWQAWHETYRGTISRPVMYERVARQEAEAARQLQGLCFGSGWAVEEADRLYAAAGTPLEPLARAALLERLHVTPLGANWVPTGTREQVLDRMLQRTGPEGELQLLFVGKDWVRKGGPLAVEITQGLHARDIPVRLHVVGCRPQLPAGSAEYVAVHGRLHQSEPEESALLEELFLTSHFLLVPTSAECYGIVFAEAQAFALPPISRRVHALKTVVEDGETGMLFDPKAPASVYIDRILELRSHPETYRAMAIAARDRFERLLNWDCTARGIVSAMQLALAPPEAVTA